VIKSVWYDNAWSSGMKLSRNVKDYKRYIDLLNITNETSLLLDIGCGDGKLLSYNPCKWCYGIDISKEAIKKAEINALKAILSVCDLEHYPQSLSYDYITAIGSLEHTDDINNSLKILYKLGNQPPITLQKSITRLYQPTKYLIVVPNKDFIGWKFKKTKGTKQSEIDEKLYSLNDWITIFEQNNFNIEKVTYDLGRSWMKLFIWLIPLKYTYQFIFVLSKISIDF
jgi:cyclopropane fatty-acyl-phospholipid synthase-like methyltransferase